ncbi:MULTISPECIES: TetR/AcrR family transcriptional regulator [Providencia]|uniref:TetR/AcrR family transcriptional regulator n=1 Tax=Providencia TaxID=586 RepID=UPI0019803F05|nr:MULTISPECIES: TetR/AcrR family transcriptional regulator [Providencia]MBN4863997.1 TetR/AcrR family transcriptional regulator [Providencia stuartii]MBN4873319.1 TetR/AcrR family transcriptional regulator [Providencia stuartii]MBN4877560.1 TetR/AcrR family transcriptional regulator [Providencia stuartii]MBN4882520.1 TetR/AcrR family transcriptional regulator [Providencia stuartii]HEM8291811.1 TetR/AcrR family transcriptional regulator [Providencia stuartii]
MQKDEPSKSTRGRPSVPEAELKEKIIQATAQSLLEEGYLSTTIDTVAKRAGVAKKTIYRFVDNRETLIEMVILSWTDSFVPLFEQEAQSTDNFFALLTQNLNAIAQKVLSYEAVGLFRLLQTDFKQKHILLDKYQKSGIERSRQLLTQWLVRHKEKQLIKQADFVVLSDLILSMAIAEPLRQISLGLSPAGLTPTIEARTEQVVALCKHVLHP